MILFLIEDVVADGVTAEVSKLIARWVKCASRMAKTGLRDDTDFSLENMSSFSAGTHDST